MNTHNQKYLTVSDRLYIEQELLQGTSFKTIAQVLHKDPTTISKEIKRARTCKTGSFRQVLLTCLKTPV